MNQKLYFFIGEHNQFVNEIKRIFQNNSRLEEIFIEIMNFYGDTFENNQYFLPRERNIILKVKQKKKTKKQKKKKFIFSFFLNQYFNNFFYI